MKRTEFIWSLGLLGLAPCLLPVAAHADKTVAPTNLVQNAGFEEGEVGGDPAHWSRQNEGGAEGVVAIDGGVAHGGRSSLRIDHTNDKGYLHPIQNMMVPPGAYLYRAWARTDADVTFCMQVYDTRSWSDGKMPDDLQVDGMTGQEFSIRKGAWQRFEMPVTVTAGFPASLQIGLRERGRLWLDDIEWVPTLPRLVLADMGQTHARGLTPEELEGRERWKIISDRGAAIAGDAWLGNQHVGIIFRKGAPSAEYHGRMPGGGWKKLSDLTPVGAGGKRAKAIRSFKIAEIYPDEIALDVVFDGDGGKTVIVRYRLRQDRCYFESESREGAEKVEATCASKFAVLPDWFGGDIVVSAEKTPAARLRFPSERMLLQFIEGGDAILMFVSLTGDQKIGATLSGEGGGRAFTSTEIEYRRDQRAGVWIAALAAPAIWHQKRISELTDIQGNRLDWKPPFEASWRVDFRRQQDGLIDSWVPTFKKKDGNWEDCRDNGSRTMWTSCRGDLSYPAFFQDGSLYLVGTKFEGAMRQTFFRGEEDLSFDPNDVALVYPYERNHATPPDAHLVADVLRQALERTPEFQLHSKMFPVEMARHRYPATCAVTAHYEKAFEQAEEIKQRRKLIEELRRMDFFVLTKRERIEEYMAWMRREHDWLLGQKAGNPGLAPLVDRMDQFMARINDTYTQGRGTHMKTPADCMALADRVEALIDAPAAGEGGAAPDKYELAKDLGKQTRAIGGAQDSVLGCMRQIVKELRQTAGLAMLQAKDDAEFGCAREIRERTMELLWQTCDHEWR